MNCASCGVAASFVPQHGQYWCDACQRYTPPPPPPASAAPATTSSVAGAKASSTVWVMLGLAIVALVAVFMPWVSSPLVSVSGVDTPDGRLSLGLAVLPLLAAIAGAARRSVARWQGVCHLLGGGALAAVAAADIADIQEKLGGSRLASVGIGIYIQCAVGATIAITGLLIIVRGSRA